MKKGNEIFELLKPIEQLSLYGYQDYFESFIKVFNNKSRPNSFLLSGSKGIGKSTFIYHFVNYLL